MFWLLSTTRRTMVPSSKRLAGAASFGVLRLSMLWGTPIPRSRRLLAATRRTRPTTAQRGQKFGSRGLRRLHRCTCSGSVTSGYDDATAPDCRCKGDMVGFLKAPGPRFCAGSELVGVVRPNIPDMQDRRWKRNLLQPSEKLSKTTKTSARRSVLCLFRWAAEEGADCPERDCSNVDTSTCGQQSGP